ncbi:MAG TPA: S-adenosylmethionine:tRNA ribosyltransferase-isomerase, partial [Prolixibacteraceae bacterium]|nr:S-adenosylmethionine:tRNA ribosyltransferase-isomerase [Prolixibacteraceae bacterium]
NNGRIVDDSFYRLSEHLPPNTLLVFNNTKVIMARLFFRKATGALIEIFLLDPCQPSDYALNFQQTGSCEWKCVVGNLKKWKSGILSTSVEINGIAGTLHAENKGPSGHSRIIRFSWDHPEVTFAQVLDAAGNIPIPPYLHRESEVMDIDRYQTVYSRIKGSVAAPTAGLHFTGNVFRTLEKKGIETAELTLHVGAGTFQPVKSVTIEAHEMHTERYSVSKELIQKLHAHTGPVIAVGTTSVRTLESLYQMGVKILAKPTIGPDELMVTQWEAYPGPLVSKTESLEALMHFLEERGLDSLDTSTQIIIVPGYSFKIVDGMLTNFHQPQSTLLLLISAYTGPEWKTIYRHALDNDYRFLSYGDSNLYLKGPFF